VLSSGAACQSVCTDPHLRLHWAVGSVRGRTRTPAQTCAVTKGLPDRTDSTIFISAAWSERATMQQPGWDFLVLGESSAVSAGKLTSAVGRVAGRLVGLCESSDCWPELPPPRLSSGPEQAKMCAYWLLKEKAGAWC